MMLFHSQGQEILSQVSQTISDESDEDDHQNVRTPVYQYSKSYTVEPLYNECDSEIRLLDAMVIA